MTPVHSLAVGAVLLLLGGVGVAGYNLLEPEGPLAGEGSGATPRSFSGITAGVTTSATGCRLEYRLYLPAVPATPGLVVLGHGFLRSKEHMEGLARALARAGMATAAVDFCNMRLWDGGHLQNGRDMVAVAGRLGARRVLYAGFSAGGLAALVAGRQDPRAVGVLALDLVDAEELGLAMAQGLDKPLVGLAGEPNACNADGNGTAVLRASPYGRVEAIPGAGHCDFESPSDGLCRLVCPEPAGNQPQLQARIIASSVAAAAQLLGN